MKPNATVLLVGGPDVDARLELMHRLKNSFNVSAIGSNDELKSTFSGEGFDYHSYHMHRRVNPIADLISFIQLIRLFSIEKPDIVHTFDTKPGIWGCFAAKLAGVPVVINTVTGLGSLYTNERLSTKVNRFVFQTLQRIVGSISSKTIFQNHDDYEQFCQLNVVSEENSMVILGSGVDSHRFNPASVSTDVKMRLKEELGISDDMVTVLMISRLIRTKGIENFVEAASLVKKNNPNVRFLLVGPDDQDSLDRFSQEELKSIGEVVQWIGARKDIKNILSISDLFVLPSAYREGIPRVLLEAGSMALPLITTDSPGCNEVVNDNFNGYLVPVNDSKSLADRIGKLVDNPELRKAQGKLSRELVRNQFDITVVSQQTSDLYSSLITEQNNKRDHVFLSS